LKKLNFNREKEENEPQANSYWSQAIALRYI